MKKLLHTNPAITFPVSIAIVLSMLAGCATHLSRRTFPPASQLPSQAGMPDPLVTLSGEQVTSSNEWFKQRRPELGDLFQHYMYGSIPRKPARVESVIGGQYGDFLGGRATLKIVTLETGTGSAPKIGLMLVVPNSGAKPAPVFLAMNFRGNHCLTEDPRVPLTPNWVPGPAASGNRAMDSQRGSEAANWPLAEIIDRGYAFASFYSGDIDPDRQDVSSGIYQWLAGGDPERNNPTNRGTIAAWAWGFHRCVDGLAKDQDIDSRRIAVVGHSRNGKAALLAAAFDERIAMAIPTQAGCGGTAPSRGKVGESVKAINDRFPHWFNAEFKQFNTDPDRLPFDQNCLVAMCAPRPVLFPAAEGDQWANPAGQFEVLKAADPVYRLLGVDGLAAAQMPPLGQLVNSRLGYYIREGKHSMTAGDWRVFLEFADRHLK
jgi:hypothetical protein